MHIRTCECTHTYVHVHTCKHAHCTHLCVWACTHAYVQIGGGGRQLTTALLVPLLLCPENWVLSHSWLLGGLSGPLPGWAQRVQLRCRHMSPGSSLGCPKMLFPSLCRLRVTQGAQCQSESFSFVSNRFLNEALKISSLPVGFRRFIRMGPGRACLGLLPGALWASHVYIPGSSWRCSIISVQWSWSH